MDRVRCASNHHRYHESLGNFTPAGVYFGRGRAITEKRRKIKIKEGETPKQVQTWAGHASTQTTWDIYGHLWHEYRDA